MGESISATDLKKVINHLFTKQKKNAGYDMAFL
jgi:hypothetical protein